MSLKVHIEDLGGDSYLHTEVSVNQRLQSRGRDFHVFPNTGYVGLHSQDSELLRAILEALLKDDVPIISVDVQPFVFKVVHNKTISSDEIKRIILDAARSIDSNLEEI